MRVVPESLPFVLVLSRAWLDELSPKPIGSILRLVSHYRLQVWPHDVSHATYFRVVPELIGRRKFLTPAIAERFNRYVEADLVPVLETICDCFGGIVDFDFYTLD